MKSVGVDKVVSARMKSKLTDSVCGLSHLEYTSSTTRSSNYL
ncbi:hypothetical protein AtNW77_Chr3g0163481 [Arabidopsis thaliana]